MLYWRWWNRYGDIREDNWLPQIWFFACLEFLHRTNAIIILLLFVLNVFLHQFQLNLVMRSSAALHFFLGLDMVEKRFHSNPHDSGSSYNYWFYFGLHTQPAADLELQALVFSFFVTFWDESSFEWNCFMVIFSIVLAPIFFRCQTFWHQLLRC